MFQIARGVNRIPTYPSNLLHLPMKVLLKSSLPRRWLSVTATATMTMMRRHIITTPIIRGRLVRLRPRAPYWSIGLPRTEKNKHSDRTASHRLSSLSLSHTSNSCLSRVYRRDVKFAIAPPTRKYSGNQQVKNRTNWSALRFLKATVINGWFQTCIFT